MSLAPSKSDLKKHLSRHIHIKKDLHPLSRKTGLDIVDSSKDQVGTTVATLPVLKPLV